MTDNKRTYSGETYSEAHRRIQGVFKGISLEMRAGHEISKLTGELRAAEHRETKRYIMRKIGEQRERLYEITGDQKHKRLAGNCYMASQQGFKKVKETYEDAQRGVAIDLQAMKIGAINMISKLTMDIKGVQHAETKRYIMEKMGEERDQLYWLTGDKRQGKLAGNCHRAAKSGFKRFE
jgi:hypothetical protein